MTRVFSTHFFRRQRLGPAQLEPIAASGVDAVELFCARPSFDYRDRRQCADLAAALSSHGLGVHSLHSPIYADEKEGRSGEPPINLADSDPRKRLEAVDEVQRALEFSEHLPFRYLIQHLGPPRVEADEAFADRALTSLERIRLLAKQAGVTVLVENIPNALAMPVRLKGFLDACHLDDVGVCFDAGHANLRAELYGGGGVLEAWNVLAPRVHSTHLHDNDAASDQHRWPGQGVIPWAELGPELVATTDLPLVLEVADDGTVPAEKLAERICQGFARIVQNNVQS